ncbi:sensor histidine kinase [Brevibacillus humidisoli]|uniref:sensor histidine kinase n=1 Tax=Brevibacillus humidisoli TaxID=2895522 RepID=UPI001E648B4C|nr:sensor histidine kinase [Brevibacillus humidisoli]UFJ41259.1 sensor histidine kinase [Brevibacillus humidisoli]
MNRQTKLSSIQWQYVRQGWALAGVIVVVLFAAFLFIVNFLQNEPSLRVWLLTYLGITFPAAIDWTTYIVLFVFSLLLASVIGVISGYVIGNLLKKRMNTLAQAAMNLERGQLSYRVPELGDDELGEIAWQFNRLAAKWEEQVASLQRLSNQKALLGEQVRQAAVLEERQRLARELHDAVSQQLFAIAMSTAAIKRLIDSNPLRAGQQIELVEEMAAAAQAEMRALLLHLRPATLQDKTLRDAIVELLEELCQKHPLEIHWEIEEVDGLPSGIEDHLFRILQEALSNSLRHAGAKKIEVKLFVLNNQVRLRIADDGAGFNPDGEKMTSYGLISMRERVAEVGGTLDVYTAVGKGTQIEVIVPLMTEADGEGEESGDDDPGYVGR